MLQRKESTNRRMKRSAKPNRDLRLAHRREFLVSLGVVDQSEANEKITDPDSPLATLLEWKKEKALQERSGQRELQKRREDEKIKQAYKNAWLINMEKETAEQSRRMEEAQDDDERVVMKSPRNQQQWATLTQPRQRNPEAAWCSRKEEELLFRQSASRTVLR